MPGTGLYSAKVTPTQLDRTQSGAPSGQTIIFTAAGLGTADAFQGGYITNVTRSETRAIVSHVDDRAVMEGDVTAWVDTDDLDVFDAWDVIQDALDQLETDQGTGVAFTATQVIRIHDGIYTENISLSDAVFNSTPDYPMAFSAGSGTPIIQNSGASHTWSHAANDVEFTYEGLHFKNDQSNMYAFFGFRTNRMVFTDCIFENSVATVNNVIFSNGSHQFLGCRFIGATPVLGGDILLDCSFEGVQAVEYSGNHVYLENCTMSNVGGTCGFLAFTGYATLRAYNCSFYGNGTGVFFDVAAASLQGQAIFRNCIIENWAKAYDLGADREVDSAVDADFNCYNDITVMGTFAGTDYTTFAEWQAATIPSDFHGNTANPDANSIDADPLLTDPANDDFSLGTESPCLNAGAGAGVITGINDVAFDPGHPDIGAWSSGLLVVAAPGITATDNGDQDSIDVAIIPGNELDVSTIYYRLRPSGALLVWGTRVTGSGTETLTGLSVAPWVIYAVAERGGEKSNPSNLEFVTVAAADQFAAIRNALYEWVKGVAGNPTVIWREPNAPQPSRQYVSIHMDPTTVVGSDYHSNADANGIETVVGNREFIFSIQVHGQPSQDDGSASISILERLRSSLEKRTIQDTLKAAGLAFVAEEGFGDLAGIGGTEFEARVFMDLRFRTTYQDTDDVGFIGTATDPVGTYDQ